MNKLDSNYMSLQGRMEHGSILLFNQESSSYPVLQKGCAISGAAVWTQVNRNLGASFNNSYVSSTARRTGLGPSMESEISSLLEKSTKNVFENQQERKFASKSDDLCNQMAEHFEKQKSTRPFVCHTCQKRFKRQYHLSRHSRIHESSLKECCRTHKINPRKPFSCEECGKQFSDKYSLKRHIFILHMNQRTYVCNHCKHMFGEKGNLGKHINMVHLKNPTYAGRFVCGECKKGFPNKRDLNRHFVTHESSLSPQQRKPFSCDKCGSRFTRKNGLNRHKEEVHNNVRSYSCHGCGKTFTRKSSLVMHMGLSC